MKNYHRWELLACGLKGHVTYQPTENNLADHLRAKSPDGEAWRCLRCGTFVLGEPSGSGAASRAPIVTRGKAARQKFIIRLLAIERIGRSIILFLVGYGVLRFRAEESALQQVLNRDLPILRSLGANHQWDVDSSALFKTFHDLLHLAPHTLTLVAIGIMAYAAIEGVEGVGLWMSKRWAEYLTVIATAAFVPLEVWELARHVTILKILALVINLAAVIWLLYTKRLFGLRGGTTAYEKELRGESLLTIKRAGSYQA